jgi:hypothetical protein
MPMLYLEEFMGWLIYRRGEEFVARFGLDDGAEIIGPDLRSVREKIAVKAGVLYPRIHRDDC